MVKGVEKVLVLIAFTQAPSVHRASRWPWGLAVLRDRSALATWPQDPAGESTRYLRTASV